MSAERIGSVYEVPRLCLPCGREFLPPRRPDGRILDYCSERCRKQAHRHLLSLGEPKPQREPVRAASPKAAPVTRPKRQPKPRRRPAARVQVTTSRRQVSYAGRAHLVPGQSVVREGCACLACADWRARNRRLPLISDLERIARKILVRAYLRGEL